MHFINMRGAEWTAHFMRVNIEDVKCIKNGLLLHVSLMFVYLLCVL